MTAAPLLSVRDLVVGYGPADIVKGVSLDVPEGQVVTIVGPNGAGKSTLLKAVAGVVRPRAGTVAVGGCDITGMPPHEIALAGLGYVPQEANVFRTLSVAENLAIGAWSDAVRQAERVDEVLSIFPALGARMRTRAGLLSGGERQMVAFGMALMSRPRMLLLDEPSAGLSPKMVEQMLSTITAVNRAGIGILMVEQNAVAALRISAVGIVMASGQVALSGEAAGLLRDRSVGELYLGAIT